MDFTIFYAWQSDSPRALNKHLIRDALKDAVRALAADGDIEESPRLDQDTLNVPGTPSIAETILEKIDRCRVFVADVTLVGSIDSSTGTQKPTPNPNVLFELGYAVARTGWDCVVLVMNSARADAEQLPFDIRYRRWPVVYRLDAEGPASATKARADLARELERALRLVIENEQLDPRTRDWLYTLCHNLISLQIMLGEFSERLWSGGAMHNEYGPAAPKLLDQAHRVEAHSELVEPLQHVARGCETLSNQIDDFSIGHDARGLEEQAADLLESVIHLHQNATSLLRYSRDELVNAENDLVSASRRLDDVLTRLNDYLYQGDIDGLEDVVVGHARQILQASYYPLTSLNATQTMRLRAAASALHLIDCERLPSDGGASLDALAQKIRRSATTISEIADVVQRARR